MLRYVYLHVRAFTIAWAILILLACSIPGQYVPSVSWLDWLSPDKWVHTFLFFVLCALCLAWSIQKNGGNRMIFFCLVICILYGVALEVMQATVFKDRSAEWEDIAANSAGCLLALAVRKRISGNRFSE
jgi:hypothetical protein